jgi:uncharacterized protein (DUF983 family)
MLQDHIGTRPAMAVLLWRAFTMRCPQCGRAPLFASYLKQVQCCVACAEEWGHLRSDDGAPWLTILVTGHIVMPVVLEVESRVSWPGWVSMALWPALALGVALALLPRAKAVLLAIIWATRAPGSEKA